MRFIINIIIITVFPFFIQKSEEPIITYPDLPNIEYCNSRYNFCIEYSPSTLPKKLISDNGDGIILYSKNNTEKVSISGSWSVLNWDCWQLYEDSVTKKIKESPDSRLIYGIVTPEYYEASFIDGDLHFYRKLYHLGSKYIEVQIIVPKGQKDRINEIREEIELSI